MTEAWNLVCQTRRCGLACRQRRVPPGLKATFHIGCAGKAQLMQRSGSQARLIALVAQNNDVIIKPGRLRVAVGAIRIQPPLQNVPVDHERFGDRAITGDLRLSADVDEHRPGTHRLPCLNGSEPEQAAACRGEKIIDRCPGHRRLLPMQLPNTPAAADGVTSSDTAH